MLVAAAILWTPGSASAQEVQDASCPGPAGVYVVGGSGFRLAQTFTAGTTGSLTGVQILVNESLLASPGDWRLEIAPTAAGVPTNTVLATETIPDASVPGGVEFTLDYDVDPPPAVAAGQTYAIVLSRPGSDGFTWAGRSGNPCAGSAYASTGPPPAGFTTFPAADDFIFATFVTPPVTTQPGAEENAQGPLRCRGRDATLKGTAGPDLLRGTPSADVIHGGDGGDRIRGLGGRDLICGGDGPDRIFGGAARDVLVGGAGSDRLRGGKAVDLLFAGTPGSGKGGGASNDRCPQMGPDRSHGC
jgi:hypothetical protein